MQVFVLSQEYAREPWIMKVYTVIIMKKSRSRIKILRKIICSESFRALRFIRSIQLRTSIFFSPPITNPINSSYQINKRETIRSVSNYNIFSLERIIVKTNKLYIQQSLIKTMKQKVNATNIHGTLFHHSWYHSSK